jgi:hypothetical protein
MEGGDSPEALLPHTTTGGFFMKRIMLSIIAVMFIAGFTSLCYADEMGKPKDEMKGEMKGQKDEKKGDMKKDEMKAKQDGMKGDMKKDEMKGKHDDMKSEMKGKSGEMGK